MCVSVFASDWKAAMIFSLSVLALTQLLQAYIHPALPCQSLREILQFGFRTALG